MLCKECLIELFKGLDRDSKDVFKTLIENGKMSKAEIIRQSELTRALVSKAVRKLEACKIVTHEVRGRSNRYWLTKNGGKLVKIMKGDDESRRS